MENKNVIGYNIFYQYQTKSYLNKDGVITYDK